MVDKKNGKDPIESAIEATGGGMLMERIPTVNIQTRLPRGVIVEINGIPTGFNEAELGHLVEVLVQVRAQLAAQAAASPAGRILVPAGHN